jgi:plasmid maintenance system killer protein
MATRCKVTRLSRQDHTDGAARRLEKLHGNLEGYYSIRINDQWRVIFQWVEGHAYRVQIIDYH